MKLFLLSIVVCSSIFAFTGEVKKDSVKLQINQSIKTYKNGATIALNAGDIVCFMEGNGRVVLKGINYKKQLSKHSRTCKQLPITKGDSSNYSYLAEVEKHVVTFFSDAKEKEVGGVSRKTITQDISTQRVITISQEKQFIAIKNSQWGPLPVRLEILNSSDDLVDTFQNEDDVITSFILLVNSLKEGYTIKVTNAFDDVLVNAKIEIKKVEH